MEKLKLKASKREILGKKTRFLRRQGVTPTHLFGDGLDSLALQCDTPTLQKTIARAGMTSMSKATKTHTASSSAKSRKSPAATLCSTLTSTR